MQENVQSKKTSLNAKAFFTLKIQVIIWMIGVVRVIRLIMFSNKLYTWADLDMKASDMSLWATTILTIHSWPSNQSDVVVMCFMLRNN